MTVETVGGGRGPRASACSARAVSSTSRVAPELVAQVEELVEGAAGVVLDLRPVTFLDSRAPAPRTVRARVRRRGTPFAAVAPERAGPGGSSRSSGSDLRWSSRSCRRRSPRSRPDAVAATRADEAPPCQTAGRVSARLAAPLRFRTAATKVALRGELTRPPTRVTAARSAAPGGRALTVGSTAGGHRCGQKSSRRPQLPVLSFAHRLAPASRHVEPDALI